tara:strand:- start:3856 stop:4149 length:294 start_codon:yes stop_codon:yes gene_type:complete
MKASFLQGIDDAKKAEEEIVKQKQEVFKEVAESNMQRFFNHFNKEVFEYSILQRDKISKLTEDEIRQLAVNFFGKELGKASFENQLFYFDKKLVSKI